MCFSDYVLVNRSFLSSDSGVAFRSDSVVILVLGGVVHCIVCNFLFFLKNTFCNITIWGSY